MPIRRGRFAPQNTFLETIAQKFDHGNSNFVLGSAQEKNNYPIVYCSDGFCELTGFSRSDLMRRSCACNFLYGLESSHDDIQSIEAALQSQKELKKEILFYKKNGSPFYCLLDIVPIKNEKGNVVLFLVSHKDVTKRRLSNEVHDDEPANANGGSQPKLSRTKSRKFSRDVLLHLSRQYQQNNNPTKAASTRSFKRSRSFSFTSERLPQYKRESTKKSKFLFLHYSTKKGLWDWWILVLTFYIAIMVPYNVAFSRHGKARDLIIVDMVIELFFILDIVVHFRTTYVNNTGRIVYEQKAIAVHYLKGWFILDFLAALPFEALYFINQSWGFLVQLLKCGRLLRLFRVVRKLHRYTEYSTVLLTLLMLAFAMVAHWLACVWYVIGLEEVSEKSTVSWLYQFGETIHRPYVNFSMDTGPDEGSAYVTSLYFTLTSMTTVGFGNVSANTNAEKAFAVIVMLIGALMHAAIFGNVAAIIQKLYANRVRYHSRANEIKQFIRVHHIDGDLSNRLEDYFHTTWSLSGGVDTREILATFPHEIQSDVCMHLYKGLLELPLFSQAPRGLVRMLSLQVRPVYVGPGEYLLMQNDVVNCIYYIASGSMEVLQGESVAAILGKGDLFGEDISRKVPIRRSNGDVRALTYCDIYYITRDLLQDVLHLYSDFSFKFSEKLELTYDLGASEKDIWRRGGLDSISEDEENEEETSDSPETGSDFATSVIRNRFDMKPSRVPKRPNHFTANEPWRLYSRPRIRGFDFNEKEPLLSTPEDQAPQLDSRIRVLQPSNKQISLTENGGSNDKIDSAEVATLEWENEPFTITKDEEASESIDKGGQHFVIDSINIDIENGARDFDSGSPRPPPEKSYKSAKDSFLKQLRSNTEDREQSNSIKLVFSDNESDNDSEDLGHHREDRVGLNDLVTPAQSPSFGMKRRSPNVSPTHSLNSNRSHRMRKSGSSLQRLEFPSSEGLQENYGNQLIHQDSSRHLSPSPSPATDSPYVSISRLFALTPPPRDADIDSPYGIHYASTPSSPARFKEAGSRTSLRRNATSDFISPASSCGGLSDDVRSTASRRSRKMSTTNAPPPSVFASLLAQASKSPYADFVPPTIVRESTITCNCEEEESCSVCGDRDSTVGTMNDNLSSNGSEDGDERTTENHIESNKSDSSSASGLEGRKVDTANERDFSSQISINYLFEPLTPKTSIELNVPSENVLTDSPDCLLKQKRQLMTRETAVYSSSSQGDENDPEDHPPKDKDYNIYKISWTSPSFDNITQIDKRTSNETIRTDSKENCSDFNFTDIVGSTSINDNMTDENERTRINSPLVMTDDRVCCDGNRPSEITTPNTSDNTKDNCENTRKPSKVNRNDRSEKSSADEEFIANPCGQTDNNLPKASTEKQETGVIPPFFDEVSGKGSGTFSPTHNPRTSTSAHSSLSSVSSHPLPTFQCPGSLTDMSVSSASRGSLGLPNEDKVHFEDSFHIRKPTISGIHSTHSLNDVPNSHRKFAGAHPLCFSEPYLQRPRTSAQGKHDDNSDDDDDSEFSDRQLEDIFKDVANARQAMERLQMILSSPEPNITSDLADTKETVKRLDQQVLHLNQDVTSLRSDVKMVLELLKGFKNGQIVNK